MNISNKIILIKPEELIPYHNNPKEHSAKQIDKIASSIKNFGFVQPIVIDGEKEVIIGHGRLAAAKKLGLKKVPVMIKDDLTPSQIRQLRLADNKVAESPWDEEMLAVELEVLMEEGADLSLTGFEEDQINSILDLNSNEVAEDSFDYEGAESRAKSNTIALPGDIWLLGRHKLICGDSTLEEVYENLFEDERADLIITDPPYNVNYGDKANMLNKYQKGHRITDHIKNDNMEAGNSGAVCLTKHFILNCKKYD
ncbi:MAG TPA: ParB N-terminal domain-containing protein [Clostridia bacterium]|nr:ParB N-terminal domain-containing protein [Clostridia bacterium]